VNTLLLITWLTLPLAPINPTEQDTLPSQSVHFTLGFWGPNGIASAGPQAGVMLEMLLEHPLVLRAGLDYRYATINDDDHPNGDLHGFLFSTGVFYYRGTDRLTGYIGGSVVLALHHLSLNERAADSLRILENIDDVSIKPEFGYRFTLGLRYRKTFSLELGITEVRPTLLFTRLVAPGREAESSETIRLSGARITFGYILPF
jgi:hypothetical protein